MSPGTNFQAAVFDLDGTLVDSETRSHESWRHVFTFRVGIVPDFNSRSARSSAAAGIDVHDPCSGTRYPGTTRPS